MYPTLFYNKIDIAMEQSLQTKKYLRYFLLPFVNKAYL